MAGKNSKILLTQSGTVKITDVYSTPSTSCTSPAPSSRHSLYSALDNDELEDGIMDEFDAPGKIHVDDELHLVGEGTRISPFLNPKVVIMLVLNLIFISLTATWLTARNFQLDLLGTLFIALSAWMLFFNVVNVIKILRQVRERMMLIGKPDDFKDYVAKLQNSQQPSLIRTNNSNNSNAPIFV